MKSFRSMLKSLVLALALIVALSASALASAGMDWEGGKITVEGMGIAPAYAHNAAQARMLARRAAIVDAYRQMGEQVSGVNVDAETTVENMMVSSDVVKTRVSAAVRGARIVDEKAVEGGYMVTMEVSTFGVSSSLATAVFEPYEGRERYPEPYAHVQPSTPLPASDYGLSIPSSTESTKPIYSDKGSSAAAAPSGRAIGGYTGLIVDCRGLGLKPVMSPVIKNTSGQSIYGYKNLDYQKVIENGMAGYTTDISRATRAGSNPLIVRAERLDNHSANPVLSLADANRVLIENGETGFLDSAKVVFLR